LKPFYDTKPQFKDLFSFANESTNYNYDTNRCSRVCRNYKLMVTASVKEVGCSMQKCPSKRSKTRDRYYLICVFNNADNKLKGRPYERRHERSDCLGKSPRSVDAHSMSTETPKSLTMKHDPTFLANKVSVENSNGLMQITDALQAADYGSPVNDTLIDNSTDLNTTAKYSPTKLPPASSSTPSHEESHHEHSNLSSSSASSSLRITRPHFVSVNLLTNPSTSLGSPTLSFGVLQFLSTFLKIFI
uniref:SCP domain-containing protein n=1 Tax=Mesocestoides corti TaxID=53468 RepID=A0A5K3FW98_MESCO